MILTKSLGVPLFRTVVRTWEREDGVVIFPFIRPFIYAKRTGKAVVATLERRDAGKRFPRELRAVRVPAQVATVRRPYSSTLPPPKFFTAVSD